MNDPIQALLATGVPVGGELPPTSRYRHVGTEILGAEAAGATGVVDAGTDGHPIVCYRRRLCPQPPADAPAGWPVETVGTGDRLDRIAARRIGDPALWWRVADVNGAIDPFELVEAPDLEPPQDPQRPPRLVPVPPPRSVRIPTGVQDG